MEDFFSSNNIEVHIQKGKKYFVRIPSEKEYFNFIKSLDIFKNDTDQTIKETIKEWYEADSRFANSIVESAEDYTYSGRLDYILAGQTGFVKVYTRAIPEYTSIMCTCLFSVEEEVSNAVKEMLN